VALVHVLGLGSLNHIFNSNVITRIDCVPLVLIYIDILVIQWGDDKNVEFAPLCVENPSQHAGACNGKLRWYTLSIQRPTFPTLRKRTVT
jgi:hypothetical protein